VVTLAWRDSVDTTTILLILAAVILVLYLVVRSRRKARETKYKDM
jgi:hypothetical protein